MKKTIIGIIIVVVSIIVLIAAAGIYKFNFTDDDIYFACPEDARICEDGSAVVRVGKDCKFEACPGAKNNDEVESAVYNDVKAAEAYKLINEIENIVIVDVSPRYDKGHIPNAVNYYVGDGSLDKAIPSLDKNKVYLVYCHVDSASILGSEKLIEAGFMKVYRLEGNYSAWYEAGYPIEVEISAVGNYTGKALASRSYLNEKFVHEVEADLGAPAVGKFYEGWLVKGSSFFSTGKMLKKGDKYNLNYESDKDSRDYKQIVITEETEANGLDNVPESHVLEGAFE